MYVQNIYINRNIEIFLNNRFFPTFIDFDTSNNICFYSEFVLEIIEKKKNNKPTLP